MPAAQDAPAPFRSRTLLDQLAETASRPASAAWSLPPACYTDPEFFALELDRLFSREWLCVGRAADIPNAGDYLTLELPGVAMLMAVRQKDGAIKVLSRVCRHRAALLGETGGGHANLFVCPYHNWVYGLDGRLRGAPAMEDTALRPQDCALPEYRAEIWEGFVFANLDPDAEPLAPRLASIAERASAYRLADLKTAFVIDDVWEANWKVPFENATETYHHIGVHKQTLEPHFPGLGTLCEPGGEGFNLHVVPMRENLDFADFRADGRPASTLNPGLDAAQLSQFLIVGIYPTLTIVFAGPHVTWFSFNPLGRDRTDVRAGWLSPPAYLDAQDASKAIARDRTRLEAILAEDKESCSGVQRGLASRDARPGPLSHLELPIAEFGRYLARRLCGEETLPPIAPPA